MRLPLGALVDPVLEGLDLNGSQLSPRHFGRHLHRFVRVADLQIQLAVRRVAGYNYPRFPESPFFGIEMQACHATLLVGTMAAEARVRKNRSDLTIEINRRTGTLQ